MNCLSYCITLLLEWREQVFLMLQQDASIDGSCEHGIESLRGVTFGS